VPAPEEPLLDAAVRAGVLDTEQAATVQRAETARRKVIDVDN
jgi:acyl-CoA dehydrogenase